MYGSGRQPWWWKKGSNRSWLSGDKQRKNRRTNSFTVLLQIYFPFYPLQTLLSKQFKETSHHLCKVSFEKERLKDKICSAYINLPRDYRMQSSHKACYCISVSLSQYWPMVVAQDPWSKFLDLQAKNLLIYYSHLACLDPACISAPFYAFRPQWRKIIYERTQL